MLEIPLVTRQKYREKNDIFHRESKYSVYVEMLLTIETPSKKRDQQTGYARERGLEHEVRVLANCKLRTQQRI
jgi:hypothetical protein